jgi:hypothetical protein
VEPTSILLLLHILSVIWLVAGLIGRAIVLGAAAKSGEIRDVQALVGVSGAFEKGMAIPGSLAVLASGLVLAFAQGQPLLGTFQGAGANWLLVSLVLYLAIIPIIIFVFVPRGVEFGHELDAAGARGEVTPGLRAAFADRAVRLGHGAEFAAVFLVLVLMVTKVV